MNINEAIVVIDDLCGKQGLYSVAWKMVRARLYAEAQKPSHNNARDEICAEILEYSEQYQYKLDLGAKFSKVGYINGILDIVKRKLSPVA
jgi:hypothetical protein